MSMTPQPIVADRYRLVEPLGQGGMGRVWKAHDEVLHREVAIKELVPPPGLTTEERQEMRERSLREARAIARLNHVNVVRIFDVLRTDGDPWIVMEYVASRSLQDVLADEGPLPPARVVDIGLGMLGALRAAHRLGVVHRDIKPGNVLLADDGRVVLTDWGLATVPGDPNVTRTGLVLGSPAYIAPERAREGIAGPRSDLWSLGATLFAAVEGTSPFGRTTAIATLAALAADPVPPARKAGPLRPVIEGLLRKDPAQRISAEDADRLLRRAAGQRRGGRSFLDGVRRQRPLPAVVPAPRPPVDGSPPKPATARGSAPAPVPVPLPIVVPTDAEAPAAEAPIEAEAPATESPEPATAAPGTTVDAPAAPAPDAAPSIEPETPSAAAGAPSTAPEAPAAASEASSATPEAASTEPDVPSTEPEASSTASEPDLEPSTAAAPDIAPSAEPETSSAELETPAEVRPRDEAKVNTMPPIIAGSVTSRPVKVVPPPPRPKPGSTRGRGPLVAAAIALALVVLVMSVLLIVLRDDDEPGGNQAAPAPSTTVPTTGSPATSAAGSTAGAGEPTEKPAEPTAVPPSNPTGPGTTKRPVPRSWRMYTGKSGFRVPVPPGMTATIEGTRVNFSGGGRLLIIDQRDDPQPDPVADWERQESYRVKRGDWAEYQKIKIVEVDYFQKAADWEWRYTSESGNRMHVLSRGFITGPKQAHGIYWSTPESRWAASFSDLQIIFDNFVPNPE
jgi:eukaryotic-like serine/threonine-protein kinase